MTPSAAHSLDDSTSLVEETNPVPDVVRVADCLDGAATAEAGEPSWVLKLTAV